VDVPNATLWRPKKQLDDEALAFLEWSTQHSRPDLLRLFLLVAVSRLEPAAKEQFHADYCNYRLQAARAGMELDAAFSDLMERPAARPPTGRPRPEQAKRLSDAALWARYDYARRQITEMKAASDVTAATLAALVAQVQKFPQHTDPAIRVRSPRAVSKNMVTKVRSSTPSDGAVALMAYLYGYSEGHFRNDVVRRGKQDAKSATRSWLAAAAGTPPSETSKG
jgi:hypothetical protein